MSRRAIGGTVSADDEKKPSLDAYADEKADELLREVVQRATTGGFSLRPFAELSEPTNGVMSRFPRPRG